MTQKEKTVITKIAKQIRKKLCNKYARGYLKDELPDLCCEASEALQLELYKHNIHTFLIQGIWKGKNDGRFKCENLHYWLEYKGNIIDLTACQFNTNNYDRFPLILIKPISRLKCFVSENIV